MLKLFFAADHAGFDLKNALLQQMKLAGYEVEDIGAHKLDMEDDYPDFVTLCAKKVAAAPGSFGVIIGGSGQGEAMAANRVSGIRAAVFYGEMKATLSLEAEGGQSEDGFDPVRLARRHNNANMLAIGARFVSGSEAAQALRIFLDTEFSARERHSRRLAKF